MQCAHTHTRGGLSRVSLGHALAKHLGENSDTVKLNVEGRQRDIDIARVGRGSIVQFGRASTRARTQTANAYRSNANANANRSAAGRLNEICNCATPKDSSWLKIPRRNAMNQSSDFFFLSFFSFFFLFLFCFDGGTSVFEFLAVQGPFHFVKRRRVIR